MFKLMISRLKEYLGGMREGKEMQYPPEDEEADTTSPPELLTFSHEALKYYRNHVRGNADIPEIQAQRKMSRNMALAFSYKKDSEAKKHPRAWYSYGALRFMVRDGEVKWIQNHCRTFPMWYKDWDRYYGLSEYFRIDEKYVK